MLTKQQILDEIKRTAKENGGEPLGVGRFEKETGVKPYDWHRYWARFGDAQKEAGFESNQLNSAYDDEFIIGKMIGLIRKLRKFPVHGELRIEKSTDDTFPNSQSLFSTKEQKRKLAAKIIEWCKDKKGYEDIIELCKPITELSRGSENFSDTEIGINIGAVYLYKSGKYYKIGKTNDTVRRGKELKIQLPQKVDLIHEIKTDDPSGIETYWHRRFEEKRMEGEWFDLNSADIKAFKRWRKIC